MVYQWTCPEENCNFSYNGKSSRCLETRVKEHNTSSTSTIFQHSITHNHPKADISQFTIIDQDRMQLSREAREVIRRNNPVLNYNIGKMNIPKIFNHILGTSYSTSTDVSTNPNDQNNNSPSSSNRVNRATRAINLHH